MAESDEARLNKLREALRERGKQLPSELLRLARAALGETNDGLSHEECIALMPEYVEAEIAGEPVAKKYRQVKHHLDICQDCAEQYAALLELQHAQRAGTIVTPETIPQPNLGFLRPQTVGTRIPQTAPTVTMLDFVKQTALGIVNAIAPTEGPDLLGIMDTFFRQVGQLGGGFAFSRGTVQAMGLGTEELTTPVAALAVVYSATGKLIGSLSPDQVDTLTAQNLLGKRAEEQALLAALELNVKSTLAKKIAVEFGTLSASDPQTLRSLIEREKH
jgi:hypothetical protein